jgi:hypothetical protein
VKKEGNCFYRQSRLGFLGCCDCYIFCSSLVLSSLWRFGSSARRIGWPSGIAKGFKEKDFFDVSDLEASDSVDNTAWKFSR